MRDRVRPVRSLDLLEELGRVAAEAEVLVVHAPAAQEKAVDVRRPRRRANVENRGAAPGTTGVVPEGRQVELFRAVPAQARLAAVDLPGLPVPPHPGPRSPRRDLDPDRIGEHLDVVIEMENRAVGAQPGESRERSLSNPPFDERRLERVEANDENLCRHGPPPYSPFLGVLNMNGRLLPLM